MPTLPTTADRSPSTEAAPPVRTVAGIGTGHAGETIEVLADRLVSLLDLSLTLKHAHWNVVGANFIAVHEMLDDMVDDVRLMSDDLAERIRTLGGAPVGTPQAIVDRRSWSDYDVGVEDSVIHLRALDAAYDGIVLDHRRSIAKTANLDPITEDLLIGQTATLEKQQWFIRSFLQGLQPDAGQNGGFGHADRQPTRDEERVADGQPPLSDETAEHAREMNEIGANVNGEGAVTT